VVKVNILPAKTTAVNRIDLFGIVLLVVGLLVGLNAGVFQKQFLVYTTIIVGLGAVDAGILIILISDYYK
jgi:hypothetical protein